MLDVHALDQYCSAKIVSSEQCAELIADAKREGRTVGLCHGGFDLLHPGHVQHFESAKSMCDMLVVSVTSDRFVSARKGSHRPIFADKLRAYMISSLSCVDFVVISDFRSGVDVLYKLRPSYYVKGPDYSNKHTPGIVAEREAVEAVGGEIRYTDAPALSTTRIIDYIAKNGVKKMLVVVDRDGTIVKNNDFFGKNDGWRDEIEFNNSVISFLSYLGTRFDSTMIVVSNQAGVARRFFSTGRVDEINRFIDAKLCNERVKVHAWRYCPFVDASYAKQNPQFDFDPKFIQEKSCRKPDALMVYDALSELKQEITDFDRVIVVGDRHEDAGLAVNLNAKFIDIKGKSYDDLIKEID